MLLHFYTTTPEADAQLVESGGNHARALSNHTRALSNQTLALSNPIQALSNQTQAFSNQTLALSYRTRELSIKNGRFLIKQQQFLIKHGRFPIDQVYPAGAAPPARAPLAVRAADPKRRAARRARKTAPDVSAGLATFII